MSTDNSSSHSKQVFKSTGLLTLGTLASRILGFVRDMLLAQLLGTGLRADAFFVAFKIPNVFRNLVGEGATHSSVVPVLTELKDKKGSKDVWECANVVFALGVVILIGLVIFGILFAPVLVRLMAPGFEVGSEKFLLTVDLTRWMFPYLFLIGLAAYVMGILYTFKSFLIPAFTSCFLNISIIASVFYASFISMSEPVFAVACGVVVGGFLQLIIQISPLKKLGWKWKWPKTFHNEGALRIKKLLIPRMVGSGVYQLTVLADTLCASLAAIVGQGGVSAIYYANRLIQFPMGVFGYSIASALLPNLSQLSNEKNIQEFQTQLKQGLLLIFFLMAPVTIIFFVMSPTVISVLFERGAFDERSTQITSAVLSFYALGLIAYGWNKVLTTAFHSMQDTKTPVKVAAVTLVVNIILNVTLMFPLKLSGIALASSLAAIVNAFLLMYFLRSKMSVLLQGFWNDIFKGFFALALSYGCLSFVWGFISVSGTLLILIKIFGLSFLTFVIFTFLLFVFRVEQIHLVLDYFRKKIQ